MRSRLSFLSLPAIGALVLAGCAGQQPAPQSAPAPAPAATAAAATPGRQWKPEDTELWTPVPKIVTPGTNGSPPSDAVVLFNGTNLDEWVLMKDKSPATWTLAGSIISTTSESTITPSGTLRSDEGLSAGSARSLNLFL